MLRYAFEHTGQAGAAHPLLARHGDVDAMTFQDLNHGFVSRDVEDLAGAAHLDRKAAVIAADYGYAGEVFAVHRRLMPALGASAV